MTLALFGSVAHPSCMKRVYRGAVFGEREMSPERREATGKQLAWVEKEVVRQRQRLAYWKARMDEVEAGVELPDDLKGEVAHFFERATKSLAAAERFRAFLIADLQDQPEYADAYHYSH